MELPTPAARYLSGDDQAAVAAFRCAREAWYERDVETSVTTRLLDRHAWRRDHTDHTVIGLELPGYGLVAVASHEEDPTQDGDVDLMSTYLEVAAVSLPLRGAILPEVEPLDPDGRPVTLGRWLLEVMLSDVSQRDRDPYVRAVVARENGGSLALCDRIGLVREEPDKDERFVQRWGVLPRW